MRIFIIFILLFTSCNNLKAITVDEIDELTTHITQRIDSGRISGTDFAALEDDMNDKDGSLHKLYTEAISPIAKRANTKWYHGIADYLPFAGTACVCGGIYDAAINGDALSMAYAKPVLLGSCVVTSAAKLGEYLHNKMPAKRWWQRGVAKLAMPITIGIVAGITYAIDPDYSAPVLAATTISCATNIFAYLKDEAGKNNRVRLAKLKRMLYILENKRLELE